VEHEPTGWLARAARLTTLAGGAMLCAVAAVVVVSVVGRYLFGRPIEGDYELVEMGMAVAIFLCFPYCHMTSTNLVAEFFSTGLGPRPKLALDAFSDAAFALVAGVFTWRLAVGLGRKLVQHDTTMLLAIPVWIGYAVAVFSMALLALVCLARMADEIKRLRR
jgi:TRAP-type C4-dicarboxylate transport system permease small subunit